MQDLHWQYIRPDGLQHRSDRQQRLSGLLGVEHRQVKGLQGQRQGLSRPKRGLRDQFPIYNRQRRNQPRPLSEWHNRHDPRLTPDHDQLLFSR